MNQFLIENYSLLTRLVELLAALTGLLCLKKYKGTTVEYFIWFLVYILVIELLGSYTIYLNDFEFLHEIKSRLEGTILLKNNWFYCLFWTLGSAVFYSFYYKKLLRTGIFIKIINVLLLCFIIFTVGYILSHLNEFFTTTITSIGLFSSFIIFMCTVFYFIEVLQSEIILNFYKSINFYISVTLFLWCLIITPLNFYNIYFSSSDWNFVFLKWQIYLFANIFMYLTFTFALIFCKSAAET